jgi:hypothetical protein
LRGRATYSAYAYSRSAMAAASLLALRSRCASTDAAVTFGCPSSEIGRGRLRYG